MIGHTVEHAIIGAMYWVPLAQLNDPHRVRQHFLVGKRVMDFHTKRWGEDKIPVYREGKGEFAGYLGLPIAEGMELFPARRLEERLSDGAPFTSWTKRPDPEHPLAAPGQREFMAKTHEAATDFYSVLIKAETGTGKTVVSLNEGAELGRRVGILVPLERLMKQWVRQVHDVLGVPMDRIGLVVGPKCQWQRDVVIMMMKSVAMREYPEEFYSGFGTMITDEVHNTGASLNSQVQGLFNARHKLALTATDERRDGSDRVYYSYYGTPAFTQSMKGVPTEVHTLYHTSSHPITGNSKTARLIGLAYDKDRNRIFSRVAKHWYDKGHCPLFLTEHTRHAEILRKDFLRAGIPENHLGMYTGSMMEGGVSQDITPEYLDWVEKKARVIIATFGMMKEGIDIPRLDRGMDCSPRSEFEQVLGRIRRRWDGKDKAVWLTLRDRAVPAFDRAYVDRIRSIKHLQGIEYKRVTLDDVLRS